MTVRFRRLRLHANTASGTFGTELEFSEGLNVIWADNTKGKSTVLQGLLYALGLERMLSPRREIPLTYVMTSYVDDPLTGEKHPILESAVWVEMENSAGDVITVRRGIVTAGSSKLVSVLDGPALSHPGGEYTQRDYFVLDAGSAQREAGFHRALADFMEWSLPTVRRFDGTETMLYLETLFPLLYVEQKAGWSSIPAAFPTWFQIRDVSRSAVEFILDLKTHALELHRQQVELDLAASRAAWSAKLSELHALGRPANAKVQGLAPIPTIEPDTIEAASLVVSEASGNRGLDDVISSLRDNLRTLEATAVPTVHEASDTATAELQRLTDEMTSISIKRNELFRERQGALAQIASVTKRITALEEDLQKNVDAKKLQNLGSAISQTLVADHCPTCDQPINDSLLAQRVGPEVMPIDDNIEYIKSQRTMFLRVRAQAELALTEIAPDLSATNELLGSVAAAIRAVKADQVSSPEAPSRAALEERIRLEGRLELFEGIQQIWEEQKGEVVQLAADHAKLLAEKQELREDRLTSKDRDKVALLGKLIRDQVEEYGLSTFAAKELEVSEQTFRPEKQGFEIGFELSASDAIRLKWAYQLALLEVARSQQTNHPGFVIFDEPRQQEAAKVSFKALLARAATSLAAHQQVIFATSEDRDELDPLLAPIPHKLLDFDGLIIQRL